VDKADRAQRTHDQEVGKLLSGQPVTYTVLVKGRDKPVSFACVPSRHNRDEQFRKAGIDPERDTWASGFWHDRTVQVCGDPELATLLLKLLRN